VSAPGCSPSSLRRWYVHREDGPTTVGYLLVRVQSARPRTTPKGGRRNGSGTRHHAGTPAVTTCPSSRSLIGHHGGPGGPNAVGYLVTKLLPSGGTPGFTSRDRPQQLARQGRPTSATLPGGGGPDGCRLSPVKREVAGSNPVRPGTRAVAQWQSTYVGFRQLARPHPIYPDSPRSPVTRCTALPNGSSVRRGSWAGNGRLTFHQGRGCGFESRRGDLSPLSSTVERDKRRS
jgi:hypothetical protein